MTVLEAEREVVMCGRCSLMSSGRLHYVPAEMANSHSARDTRQDRADRFRRRLKELRAEQVESYQRMPPKLLPRFGQVLWDIRILAERIFRRTPKPKRAFTALQRVKASIGR